MSIEACGHAAVQQHLSATAAKPASLAASTPPRLAASTYDTHDAWLGALLRIVNVKHSGHVPRAGLSLVHTVAPTTTAVRLPVRVGVADCGHTESEAEALTVRCVGSLKWHISHIAPVTTDRRQETGDQRPETVFPHGSSYFDALSKKLCY
ncbi:hypothetical protein AWZ03_007989 [Drosophila navojoa]|uniref:Uncharacterized protein n=1 Tax=Drosophila navojoa TaxID=7232 RepID=A0A484BAB5_DRONA|nr:hypothetical protein AWZ03_007989 [Drosophila navojoa]